MVVVKMFLWVKKREYSRIYIFCIFIIYILLQQKCDYIKSGRERLSISHSNMQDDGFSGKHVPLFREKYPKQTSVFPPLVTNECFLLSWLLCRGQQF